MNVEVKTAITEVTVPVKVGIGGNYRINPHYGHLGIESRNITVVRMVYYRDLELVLRTKFLEDFGIDEPANYAPGFIDSDIIVVYKDKSGELECMELEFFVDHISPAC